jgi:NADPH-dependent glutamate synthase beta subunit-like oxidoreductase/dihydroorotate dehydrogenase/Pyruvate/2-oxoacid:ferredoxin oxidoreductase delta subunit
MKNTFFLSKAQLQSELERCQFCKEKPCLEACPAHCSPADFIMAARVGKPADLGRAAAQILNANPFGETCGLVCPDTFCMDACSRKLFDSPIQIPKVQATIVHRARELGTILDPVPPPTIRKERIAIVGAGPAGLAAAATLGRLGYTVELFESEQKAGGACRLIPDSRLPKKSVDDDIEYLLKMGRITLKTASHCNDPEALFGKGFSAVLVSEGQQNATKLKVHGELECAISYHEYLKNPGSFPAKKVAVIGGGAVALDCAVVAHQNGASAELFVRRGLKDMPITQSERDLILEHEIDVTTRTRVLEMKREKDGTITLETVRMEVRAGSKNPKDVVDVPGTRCMRSGFDRVVLAIGSDKKSNTSTNPLLFWAGDCANGETTVVEASAAGKNAGMQIHNALSGNTAEQQEQLAEVMRAGSHSKVKSRSKLRNTKDLPVSLETNFFGLKLKSPFLLSAAPHTDGFDEMKRALDAGWPGGIMKTAFDGIPIHIPDGYMYTFGESTYGNCDNVSGHPLSRVCKEVAELRLLYPDRLIGASTGGSLSGNDAADKHSWQSNTKKLEAAGAQLVEYSLSCPQGGDGSEGAIASQNAALSAKIVDWVMDCSDPDVPKLFKLSGAVTSIQVIVAALQEVFKRYPNKKGGVTLANSFPALTFRPSDTKAWDEGVVVGLAGEGIAPISYLSLASVGNMGVTISGNGGAMNYLMAANFLALGVKTVQFCTIAMKHGVEIIDELHAGLSHLLQQKGFKSVDELVGCALPKPIADFMELSAEKKISDRDATLCTRCGNCTHCGYQAIKMVADGYPETDASKCIGCSICVKTCFAGAMMMRTRTASESAVTPE